jgi:hypothetical protein
MAEGIGMEKSTSSKQKKYDEWEVRDAMHTIMRAGDHLKDKKLMGHVRKHAKAHAAKLSDDSARAARLAKSGRISEKAMAKLSNKRVPSDKEEAVNLDKSTPIA